MSNSQIKRNTAYKKIEYCLEARSPKENKKKGATIEPYSDKKSLPEVKRRRFSIARSDRVMYAIG